MEDKKNAFQFPCSYPLKVVGINTNGFYSAVCAILERYLERGTHIAYASRTSSGGKYMSITATFVARDYEQLTAIYRDLNELDLVIMTL